MFANITGTSLNITYIYRIIVYIWNQNQARKREFELNFIDFLCCSFCALQLHFCCNAAMNERERERERERKRRNQNVLKLMRNNFRQKELIE